MIRSRAGAVVVFGVMAVGCVCAVFGKEQSVMSKGDESLLKSFVEANIIATHAYQVRMAQAAGKGETPAWAAMGVGSNELALLVKQQEELLACSPEALRNWVEGRDDGGTAGARVAAILASPLRASNTALPLNVFEEDLGKRTGVTGLRVRALASILQMMMDVERDADLLQTLYARYAALGLPVHTAQLGLKASTDEEFLAIANEVAPRLVPSPFETDPVTVRMIFRKMWNWGHRHTGERDKAVLARELLAEPEVAKLVPALGAMPAQKIAVIGHSFTMNVHWASPSAFVPVAAAAFVKVNPKVEVRQWQAGGMNASRADCQAFYHEALAWKPDRVLLLVANRGANDPAALEKMVTGFTAQGAKVAMFDDIYDGLKPNARFYWEPEALREIAGRTGMDLIKAGPALDSAPGRDRFVALDGVHMTEPYHRVMAKLWLEYLAGSAGKAGGSAAKDNK